MVEAPRRLALAIVLLSIVTAVPGSGRTASNDAGLAAAQVSNDEKAILAVLQAYEQAYSDLVVADVQRVFPKVDESALKAAFDRTKSQQARITSPRISVTGDKATVVGTWQVVFQGKVGRPLRRSEEIRLVLQKREGRWVIEERCERDCR